MNFEADDPILDALLDEVLADHGPPDLSAQILSAWGTSSSAGAAPRDVPALPVVPSNIEMSPPPAPPPILPGIERALNTATVGPAVSSRRIHRQSPRRTEPLSAVLAISVAAAVVGLGLTIGLMSWLQSGQPQVAQTTNSPQPQVTPAPKSIVSAPKAPEIENDRPSAPQVSPDERPQIVQQSVPETVENTTKGNELPERITIPIRAPAVASSTPRAQRGNPSTDAQVVSFVNAELSRTWKDAGVKPTPAISDAEWCERLFVRLLGRLPTTEELKRLADDKAANRREKFVDRLLTQSAYGEEFAQHWSAVLTNVFLGKSGGRGASLASREELEKYFTSALQANKPFDEISENLLTATGSAKAGTEDYNPAVNFLLDRLNNIAVAPTARVARVLLGHQLQCAQCHTHPTQEWTQDQFWALNASLRGIKVERVGEAVRLANAEAPGEASVVFETPDGVAKAASPRFIDGTEIPAAAPADLRKELARLVTNSDDFSKAAVNRVWAQVFDYGFTRPVDDLGPNASVAAPAVLDRLATEFAAHNFDLKRLLRWTVLTESFARSSNLTDLASKDMPEAGEPALFSRFYDRPAARAGALDALVQVNRIRATVMNRGDVEKARIDWLMQANRTPTKGGKLGPAPAVVMQAGDPRRQPASGDPTGLVKKLAASDMPFAQQVEHLFLAALDRPPLPREQQAALQLSSSRGNPSAALEDIWWALQNSSECVIDR